MVEAVKVEHAISAHRERMAQQHRATEDYKARVLYGSDRETIRTDWGGYRISGDFTSRGVGMRSAPRRAMALGVATRASSQPKRSIRARSAIRVMSEVRAVATAR